MTGRFRRGRRASLTQPFGLRESRSAEAASPVERMVADVARLPVRRLRRPYADEPSPEPSTSAEHAVPQCAEGARTARPQWAVDAALEVHEIGSTPPCAGASGNKGAGALSILCCTARRVRRPPAPRASCFRGSAEPPLQLPPGTHGVISSIPSLACASFTLHTTSSGSRPMGMEGGEQRRSKVGEHEARDGEQETPSPTFLRSRSFPP